MQRKLEIIFSAEDVKDLLGSYVVSDFGVLKYKNIELFKENEYGDIVETVAGKKVGEIVGQDVQSFFRDSKIVVKEKDLLIIYGDSPGSSVFHSEVPVPIKVYVDL